MLPKFQVRAIFHSVLRNFLKISSSPRVKCNDFCVDLKVENSWCGVKGARISKGNKCRSVNKFLEDHPMFSQFTRAADYPEYTDERASPGAVPRLSKLGNRDYLPAR